MPGLGAIPNEDVVAYDPFTGTWEWILDGSDLGLASFAIDGLALLSSGDILLSFTAAGNVNGLTGGPSGTLSDDSDIILFHPTSLGSTTTGTFQFYFDGSDVGLVADGEDVDAITLLDTGELAISTLAPVDAPGATGGHEDVWVFHAEQLGANTVGFFTKLFDGRDVELGQSAAENVDAVGLTAWGTLLLSTSGEFATFGLTGSNEDIFEFTPLSWSFPTNGFAELSFDLSQLGIEPTEDVAAMEWVEGSLPDELPDVEFVLSSLEGPVPLEITGQAITSDGRPLPEGDYTWLIDGEPDAGPMNTHFSRTHTFTASGVHTVALWVAITGVPALVPCFSADTGTLEGRTFVWPRVTGHVATESGGGVGGVSLIALPDGFTSVSRPDGTYELSVPFGWSGFVMAQHAQYRFTPEFLSFSNVMGTVLKQDFSVVKQGGVVAGRVLDSEGAALTGVQLRAESGDSTVTVYSGAGGVYTVHLPNGWSGSISPAQSNYTFTPQSRFLSNLQGLTDGQDFVGVLAGTGVVTGFARTYDGLPHSGIRLSFVGSDSSVGADFATTTGADGSYTQSVPMGWSGMITMDAEYRLDSTASNKVLDAQGHVERDWVIFRNYFVAPGGNDLQTAGSMSAPFKTVQKAANITGPGDTIYLRAGHYDLRSDPAYRQGVIHFVRSGESNRPITVEGYGSEAVSFSAGDSRPIFDFSTTWGHNTNGFGHYVFRKLRVGGGRYGWLFRPEPLTTWQPGDPISSLHVSQIHDVVIEDCEVDGQGSVESGIYARYGGIRNLTVRRCNFHHTVGTEGTVDIGQWKEEHPAYPIPRSASHDLVFEDCEFHHSVHQQSNGIVFQGSNYDITLRRCRAYNNGKYGFACKGSGGYRLDRCAAWGNDSSQMYCRGFDGGSGLPRPPALNDLVLTNCVFIAPPDQRGGGALNWRENVHLSVYHSTVVGLRNEGYGQAGGYSFELGHPHAFPVLGVLRNSIVVGYTDSPALRFSMNNGVAYLTNTRYEAGHNLFFSDASTKFRYQSQNWRSLSNWQAYWSLGEANGDDALRGPRATQADSNSVFASPEFLGVSPLMVPLRRQWSAALLDSQNHCDVRVGANSAAVGLGENLGGLGMAELLVDYEGRPRPAVGAWTAGAFVETGTSSP